MNFPIPNLLSFDEEAITEHLNKIEAELNKLDKLDKIIEK